MRYNPSRGEWSGEEGKNHMMTETELPTFNALYDFLREHYKTERFEGRNGPDYGQQYSRSLTSSAMVQIERLGNGFISRQDSASGRAIKYNHLLKVL